MKVVPLHYFGLVRPFRFERVLVLLLALAMLLAIGVGAMLLLSRDAGVNGEARGLSWGTPRGWYFVYLAALLGLSLVLAPWWRVAMGLLSLAAVEIGLGFGAAALYLANVTLAPTLFPENYNRPLYRWHPLLQAVAVPTPSDETKTARVFINSHGLRGPERTADQFKDKIVVALFGGSTTLDFSNRNGESWGDLLQRSLGDRYAVVNHGAPGYTTAEHVIQTAFYQDAFGVSPHCSVYYVGWNDLTNAHIEGLDPGYANYHMPGQIDFLDARRLGPPLFSISPMLKLLSRFVAIAFDTARPAGAPPGHVASGADPVLDEIYLRNIRTISAINRQRGFATLWVDQVMNPERVSSRTMRGWIPFVPPQDTPTLFVHFNKLLQREAASLGDTYANIPEAVFTDRDFIDEGHFSPSGARKFAAQLFHAVMSACPR
jgi:lysophospholipase L1-like esterase